MPNEKKNIHYSTLYCFNTIISQNHLVNFSRYFFDAEQLNQFAVSIIHLVFSNHGVVPVAFAQLETGEEFPRVRDFLRVFLFRFDLDYTFEGEREGGRSGGAIDTRLDGYLCTCIRYIKCVSRIHKRNSHMRGDRVPQVSLGPHWHNTFTDVTLHSKLLRCRRTRISSSLPPSPCPTIAPGER